MAQRVGFAAAPVRRAAHDEVAHLYGKDAIRVRGQAGPALDALRAGLHDHLGRRTVENPDLMHRAKRQGLAGHVADLGTQGFTVLERAVSDDVADEIRETTVRVLADHGVTSLNWMLYQGRCFELLAQHPTLMTLVDASLGRGAVIGLFSAIQRIFRSLEPKRVDPQMLHRNAPRLGELLGDDDWFEKMHGIGRDHTRFAHMQRLLRFTEHQKAALLVPDR